MSSGEGGGDINNASSTTAASSATAEADRLKIQKLTRAVEELREEVVRANALSERANERVDELVKLFTVKLADPLLKGLNNL